MKQKYQYIQCNILHNVINIILDRQKKKNALNPNMILELINVLNENKDNKSIRVVLISSSSDVFCAGADIEYLNKIRKYSFQQNLEDSKQLMSLFQLMLSYPKLIITKVTGAALGGGCGIMTASDIIFATSDSKFGYPEVKIGFTPALVSSFLIQRINIANIKYLLLNGKTIDAKQGKEIGLINYLCENENIDKKVNDFIKKFTKTTSPLSIANTKKILYSQLNLKEKLEEAAKFNAESRMNEDFKKGIKGFLDKQLINWNDI
ncbi:MAG: methylglutaconyl-CoA hydratase [Flavobacteriales bacterium]|nr:methylglutaconyl-CoA hydratase [Flavobacteriales bacterium]|tara:strand:- start:38 stop:826 length:789 start_codon:yes stop_codon:yes gene_type:complete